MIADWLLESLSYTKREGSLFLRNVDGIYQNRQCNLLVITVRNLDPTYNLFY
jgi:hypothetical protein